MGRHELPEHKGEPMPVPYERRVPEVWSPPIARETEVDDLQALLGYIQILWRNKWILAAFGAAGLVLALVVSLFQTPIYRASVNLEIQGFQEPLTTSLGSSSSATIATHSQLLTSRSMRLRAAEATPALEDDEAFPEVRGTLAQLRSVLGLPEPMESMSWGEAISYSAATMQIVPPSTNQGMIVTIRSESPNPAASAAYLNTLAEQYIQRIQEERWAAFESAGDFLTQAASEQKIKLEESQQRLAEFARSQGLVFTDETTSLTEQSVRQVQQDLAQATADRIALEARYQASLSSPTEALPEVLDSGPMASYQMQLADLRRQHAQLSTTLTPAHFRVREIQSQIEALEATMQRERENIKERARIEYEAALGREEQLRSNYNAQARLLSDQSEMLMTYEVLRREVETNNQLYERMLAEGKEASVAAGMRPTGARIVDAANTPTTPYRPNLTFNFALGVVAGLGLGSAVALFRSRSDTRIQAPGRLTSYLQVRELGVIPSAKSDPEVKALARKASRIKASGAASGRENGGNAMPHESLELVAWTRKPSFFADSVRSAMTSILYSGENGSRPRVILITSPSPQEGKSTITSNLAIALAEINQRVLLIDGDLRRPRVHDIFDVPNTFGLGDVLHERTPIADYDDEALVRKTRIPDLSVLPAGPGRASVTPLLHSDRMRSLLARFRDQFDIILIDAAPVLTVPDARVLARVADAVVLVFRAHSTTEESALAAAKCFTDDGTRILGTILNDWNPVAAGGTYSTYYSAYHSPYHH